MIYLSIMKRIKRLIENKKTPILYLAFVTVWLRLVNLGYSDYQGDEIKALFRPSEGQSLLNFLMNQRKGPIQFLITYLMRFIDPTYMNQFLMRLPFAIAGVLSVYFFYKLVQMYFDKKVALYAALFVSMNGILVAFSRIVQYQSFTILFFILALYYFSKTIKKTKWEVKGWYVGMIFWALSILTHYDGGFIAPFVLYIFVTWYKKSSLPTKEKIKHIVLSSLIFGILLSSFFVPYIFSISSATKDYWLNRLSGGEGKISSSVVTFKTYNPKYIFYIFSGLVVVSFLRIKKIWPVVFWVAFPLILWELITSIPGTHIYNYLIPLAILAGVGITVIEDLIKNLFKGRLGEAINQFGLTVLFLFMFLLANAVFVNHTTEYPWENEEFMFWTLHKPNPIFHLSMFGFPYNRNWEEIGEYVLANTSGYFSTNERKSIPRFYVPLPKDTPNAGHYISIKNPQSFASDFIQEKAKYWGANYDPVHVIEEDGKVLAEIYFMPQGNLDTIKALGY